MKRCFHWALSLMLALLVEAQGAPTARVRLPAEAPAPVRFGARELESALRARGVAVAEDEGAAELLFRVARGERAGNLEVPPGPEAFALAPFGRAFRIAARDAVGMMYGLLELADQVRLADPTRPLAEQLEARAKASGLELRAVSQGLSIQALEDPDSWYFDEDFWRDYFAMLARSRHNLADFHAALDLPSGEFSNFLPFFATVEGFEDVGATAAQARAGGVPREVARRNLAMCKRILQIAAEHGVRVALTNYTAQTWRGRNARAMGGDELLAYLRSACGQFVEAVPDLWMHGLPIGESGRPESLLTVAAMAALKDNRARIKLHARAWPAGRENLAALFEGFSGELFLQPNYNGEQLGLPYHALTTPARGADSGFFAACADGPRDGRRLYHVRVGSAHRIFHWGGYEFARRCAATGNHAAGAGLSVEPPTARDPIVHRDLEPGQTPPRYYRWATQRDWMWYQLWGRLMFDPSTSEAVFAAMYAERFGDEPGRRLWRATQESSRIVPLISSYHCLGAERRDMAPEMEVGVPRRSGLSGLPAETGDYDDFLSVRPLDEQVMAGPVEYVAAVLAGTPDGRLGPLAVADLLEAAAQASEAALAPLSVSGLQRRGFQLRRLSPGVAYYTDRAYTILAIPDRLEDAILIATPNDEKGRRGSAWSFRVDAPAEVHVAWDERNPKPEWMGAFAPTDEQIAASDREASPYRLYRRTFPAGPVELGAPASPSSHYFVVVAPERAGTRAEVAQEEYEKIRLDVEAVAWLGRFYAARLRAAVGLEFYKCTGDFETLRQARIEDLRATSHWERLAGVADGHYAPLRPRPDTHGEGFTWTREGQNLANQTAQLFRLDRDAEVAARERGFPLLGHTPPAAVSVRAPLSLQLSAAHPADRGNHPRAVLHYRSDGQAPYREVEMTRQGMAYTAQLPELPAGARLEYYFSVAWRGRAGRLPEAGAQAPFSRLVRGELDPPRLLGLEAKADPSAGTARVSAALADDSGVSRVVLYHKPILSHTHWEPLAMKESGEFWMAEAPIAPSGLQYYIEAVDIYGNAKVYPDFLVETPYRTLPGRQTKEPRP